jgi:hypothetical protein
VSRQTQCSDPRGASSKPAGRSSSASARHLLLPVLERAPRLVVGGTAVVSASFRPGSAPDIHQDAPHGIGYRENRNGRSPDRPLLEQAQ